MTYLRYILILIMTLSLMEIDISILEIKKYKKK